MRIIACFVSEVAIQKSSADSRDTQCAVKRMVFLDRSTRVSMCCTSDSEISEDAGFNDACSFFCGRSLPYLLVVCSRCM